jgi:hypothetical protein
MLDADDSAKNRAADALMRHRRHFVFKISLWWSLLCGLFSFAVTG